MPYSYTQGKEVEVYLHTVGIVVIMCSCIYTSSISHLHATYCVAASVNMSLYSAERKINFTLLG